MKQLQDVEFFFIYVAFTSENVYENEEENLIVEIIPFGQICCASNRMALPVEFCGTVCLFLKLAHTQQMQNCSSIWLSP